MLGNFQMQKNLEFEQICRGCLGKKGDMKPLYGSYLDEMLRNVAQVDVQCGDGLPELMCLQCVLQVSRAFRFKQQCERSDATLRKYFLSTQDNLSIENANSPIVMDEPGKNKTGESSFGTEVKNTEKCIFILENGTDLINYTEENAETTLNVNDDENNINNKTCNFGKTFEINVEQGNMVTNVETIYNKPDNESTLQKTKEIGNEQVVSLANLCEECDFNGNNEVDLKNHIDMVHNNIFQCNVCDKIFQKLRILKRHLKIHDPIKPHNCTDCGMSFTENSNLTKHRKKHTGELRNMVGKPNLCSVCGKSFKWGSSLSKHMNHHTKNKILNCPFCPKYYVENRSLKVHLRTHSGERPYVCNVCDKGFTQMCNLEKHLRVHTGEKPYSCPICGKGFTQSGYVAIHMRSHTGEKPYKCVECGKCFAGSNTLAIHKRTHTGERPYLCIVCGKSFARFESCAIHQRTHSGEKTHICSVCERGFISSGRLTIHMRSHTDKSHICKICNKKFPSIKTLKAHMKIHSQEKLYEHNTIIVFNGKLDTNEIEQEYNSNL